MRGGRRVEEKARKKNQPCEERRFDALRARPGRICSSTENIIKDSSFDIHSLLPNPHHDHIRPDLIIKFTRCAY